MEASKIREQIHVANAQKLCKGFRIRKNKRMFFLVVRIRHTENDKSVSSVRSSSGAQSDNALPEHTFPH